MRTLKKNEIEYNILIKKFINYLIRNGKKLKSKKLLADCCLYTDKLLKKKYKVKEDHAAVYPLSGGFQTSSKMSEANTKALSNKIDLHYRRSNFFSKKTKQAARSENNNSDRGFSFLDYPTKKGPNKIGKQIKSSLTTSRLYFCNLQKGPVDPLSIISSNKPSSYKDEGTPFQKGEVKRKLTPKFFFQDAIYRLRPLISLQKLRKGGRTRYIPRALSAKKGMFIGLKWVINSSIKKYGTALSHRPVSQSLANELWNCFLEQGFSWQKKEELHKLGAANKAFIRYNWW